MSPLGDIVRFVGPSRVPLGISGWTPSEQTPAVWANGAGAPQGLPAGWGMWTMDPTDGDGAAGRLQPMEPRRKDRPFLQCFLTHLGSPPPLGPHESLRARGEGGPVCGETRSPPPALQLLRRHRLDGRLLPTLIL